MKNLFCLKIIFLILLAACTSGTKTFVVNFNGKLSEKKWAIRELSPELPSDWSAFGFLTFELRSSTTQRFDLKIYDTAGVRRLTIQPFQGAWIRASIPLVHFQKRNTKGMDLAAIGKTARPGLWIGFSNAVGSINKIDTLGVAMRLPIGSPALEIRNVELTMNARDTIFGPVPLVDEFGQWIPAGWTGKARSLEDLKTSWNEEDKSLQPGNFNVSKYGGFLGAKINGTGFFRVEQINGRWWFVDPNWSDATLGNSHRKAYVATLRGWGIETGLMGMPDVYDPDYAGTVDRAAEQQCAFRKDDPFLLGYFIGNEPPWPNRELELANEILSGNETPMQTELKKYSEKEDTPERRKAFVYDTYAKFIGIVNVAVRKYDPNHLNLGLRFGGSAPDEIIKTSKCFDVFSFNNYGYSVNASFVNRVNELTGLPMIIGEFHFGVPGRGLAPGLAQTPNQTERGVAYCYYVENAAASPAIIGIHWFQWWDQPSTGRGDGENYNIGMVDVTDRPYKELIDAARETHKRLFDIHSGKIAPVTRQAMTQ